MRLLISFITIFIACTVFYLSCAKYKDPPHQSVPGNSHYCNDPKAVNYNWGFPGIADNTICYYLVDLFKGTYIFADSVTQASTLYYVFTNVDTIHIYALSQTHIGVVGFCKNPYDTIKFGVTISSAYIANSDTLVGDSVTNVGQLLCRPVDTLNGTLIETFSDTGVLQISFMVYSDTGATIHKGTAIKHY